MLKKMAATTSRSTPRGAAMITRAGEETGRRRRRLSAAREVSRDRRLEPLFGERVLAAMAHTRVGGRDALEALSAVIDRRARGRRLYEMVPRSQGGEPAGTAPPRLHRALPDIAAWLRRGVLTPILPIGRINRKGRKTRDRGAGDHGAPTPSARWKAATTRASQLGTLVDFRALVDPRDLGHEIALDFGSSAAGHPGCASTELVQAPARGSIRSPRTRRKVPDIHNPDFTATTRPRCGTPLRDVVLCWIAQGVRIFRVDNPHTKPFPFWEWLIADIQKRDPDVIFLAEAFTRPKVMKALAKLGFTQSYTYFTWRTQKWEIEAYLNELTGYPEREYYRPNFFVNTPDILPFHLQGGEPWMFKSRVALAATLSGTYGIYNGFELIEHERSRQGGIPHSQKYEIKVRDGNAPGNIRASSATSPGAARQSRAAADGAAALPSRRTAT